MGELLILEIFNRFGYERYFRHQSYTLNPWDRVVGLHEAFLMALDI